MRNAPTKWLAVAVVLAVSPMVASAQNLVPNSSFEVGAMERRWSGTWDNTTAWHGSSCAKLPAAPEDARYVPARCRSLVSCCFPVAEADAPYVLSLYLKATVKMPVTVGLRGNATGKDDPPRILHKTVWADTEWKRFAFHVKSLPAVPYNSCFIQINKHNARVKGALFVDAVQLEKGTEPTPYKSAEEVAFGLRTDKVRNIFEPGRVVVNILAYNREETPKQKHLDFLVKDFRDLTVFVKKDIIILCPPDKTITVPVSFEPNRLGSLRAELYERGGKIQDQLILSVLSPVPLEDRNLGYAYGARPDDPLWAVYPKYLGLRFGGRWIRWSAWTFVQPNGPDEWSWEKLDKEVALAERAKIKFVATFLGGVPKWAREKKNKKRPHPYGFDLDDWERYVSAIAARYAGRVDSWGVWNEPYFHDLKDYLELMKVTYPAIKKANPRSEVCGVDTPATTAGWAEKYIKAGGLKYIDAFSTHSYSAEGGYLPETLARLQKWASFDGKPRPVYNTETQTHPWWTFSWYTHLLPVMSSTRAREYTKGLSAEEGAQRWAKLYIANRAMGVKVILPHVMLQDRASPAMLRELGGLEHDLSLSPKLCAWAAAGRIIGTARPHGQLRGSPLLRIMMFSKGSDAVAVVWTRQHESPPLDTDVPSEKSYRSFEDAALHKGIVRFVNLVKGGTLTLDAKAKIKVLDMMGTPVETRNPNAVPVSMDPTYIVAENTKPEALGEILKRGVLRGFGRFKAVASVATGPEGDAGVTIAVQSLWGADQKLIVEAAGATSLLKTARLEATLPAGADIELVLPFKDPRGLPEKVGPFKLTLKADDDARTLEVPAIFVARSYAAGKAVKLDGRLDEWTSPISLRLDSARKILNAKAKADWKGPEDSSLVMRSTYDENYLYFAFDVTDNSIRRAGSPGTMYRGDCMEMFFDANVLGDLDRGGMDSDDFRVNCGPSVGDKFPGGEASLASKGVKTAAVKTPKGYTIEVAVPWSLFLEHGAGPYAGTVIGFTVNQYDKDEGEKRVHAVLSWAEKPQWWTNTGTWGRLMLVE